MSDYALVLMAAAARHCGGVRVSATDLAAETGLPLPTAQKLVTILTRAGLLRAVRGTGGGIQLARPAAAISAADIVEAVEGPIGLTACAGEVRHDCTLEADCRIRPAMGDINLAVRGALAGMSLAALARYPARADMAQIRAEIEV